MCPYLVFNIFCYAEVFVIVDQFLIFWQCLTTLCLSVVKKYLMASASFLLLFFYGVLLLTICVWNYVCLRQKKWYLRLFNYERGFSKHKIHIWLYELLSWLVSDINLFLFFFVIWIVNWFLNCGWILLCWISCVVKTCIFERIHTR